MTSQKENTSREAGEGNEGGQRRNGRSRMSTAPTLPDMSQRLCVKRYEALNVGRKVVYPKIPALKASCSTSQEDSLLGRIWNCRTSANTQQDIAPLH